MYVCFFCQAGFHIQLLLSYYTINWPLILYSLCMIMAVSYCYGQKRYISDLCCLSNTKLQETTMTHLVVLFTTVVPVFLVVSHKYRSHLWFKLQFSLTLILLTWRIGWAYNNARKQRIGRWDVFVTVHPWYNYINNQLGATITVY